MRFEARELKSYGEPILSGDLRQGEVYFAVQFADEQMFIPVVEPLIFLGKNIDGDNAGLHYFQNFESYSAGIRYESASDDERTAFQVCGSEGMKHIFEFDRALESLMKCSLRRQKFKKSV